MLLRTLRLWGLLAAVVAAAHLLPPQSVETLYARTCYPWIAGGLVAASGRLPFSLTEAMLPLILLTLSWRIRQLWRRSRHDPLLARLALAVRPLVSLSLGLYATFLVCWGLNYARPDLEARLALPEGPPQESEVATLAHELVRRLNERVEASRREPCETAERAASEALRETISKLQSFCPRLPVAAKPVFPAGLLTTFGFTGVTSPWLLEAHVDGAILAIERPFVAAHEKAHVAGFAPEGDANFVAYLACRASTSPLAAYSADLALLGETLAVLGDETRRGIIAELASAVRDDWRRIRERQRAQRWELGARVNRELYDAYLRTQKVKRGVRDYARVLDLLIRWERGR
ncbi:MAG: DUF3810 family protein [Planctomycetota bacterium]